MPSRSVPPDFAWTAAAAFPPTLTVAGGAAAAAGWAALAGAGAEVGGGAAGCAAVDCAAVAPDAGCCGATVAGWAPGAAGAHAASSDPPATVRMTWSALRRVSRLGCMLLFPPSKNRANGAAQNPLLFRFRELVGVAQVVQRLGPRVVGFA